MISPELLRRYPFFSKLNEEQIKALAMMGDEIELAAGEVILEAGKPADWLFLLVEGDIELYYKSEEEYHPKSSRQFFIGEINPGEIFGISALIEPYVYNSGAKSQERSKIIRFDANALRELSDKDLSFGSSIMRQIAKTAFQRLASTRVQLAAAWAS